MGFYLRNSIRVGPVRFNLSRSGIGMSAGITGLRIGAGPRGNYIHMGRHGVYYRATLPSGAPARARSIVPAESTPPPLPTPPSTNVTMHEIESVSCEQLRDSSSVELLDDINRRRNSVALCPLAAVVGIAAVVFVYANEMPTWVAALIAFVALVASVVARLADISRRSVVLAYSLDEKAEADFSVLHEAFSVLRQCAAVWHVEAQGRVDDWKRNSGVNSAVLRKRVTFRDVPPSFIKTNIAVPTVPAGRKTLCFFPDRVLVFESGNVGAVSYEDIVVARCATRFVESEGVPADATTVGRTWQFVNRNGGPDRRFKNNRELPIALYDEMDLTSGSGLRERFQLSRTDIAADFARALAQMRGAATVATA